VQQLSLQLCDCVDHLEVQEKQPDLFCLHSHTTPVGRIQQIQKSFKLPRGTNFRIKGIFQMWLIVSKNVKLFKLKDHKAQAQSCDLTIQKQKFNFLT